MKRQQAILKMGALLCGALCLSLSLLSTDGHAYNVRIIYPPAYRIVAPPVTVVIPGTYVYVVPDIDVDIFFFRGYWYRPHRDHWFRASSYNGPWSWVPPKRVPRELFDLPHHDYRRIPPGYSRIPYGQLKKDWRRWERDRYWERDRAWREGWRRDDRRDDRFDDDRHDRRGWQEPRRDHRPPEVRPFEPGRGPQAPEARPFEAERGPGKPEGPRGK